MSNKKLFGYIQSKDVFESKKIACDSTNETYWDNGVETYGTPDIRFEQIVFIENEKLIWTHGTYYPESAADFVKTVNGIEPDEDGNVNVSGDIPIVYKTAADTTATLSPNVMYIWPEMTMLSIDLEPIPAERENFVNMYMLQFSSKLTSAVAVSWPNNIKWASGNNITAGKTYQAVILNNIAMMNAATTPSELTGNAVFNVSTDIGTTVTRTTGTRTYTVQDSKGEDFTVTATGGGSYWSVATGNGSFVVDGETITASYRMYFQAAGSTSSDYLQFSVLGPCKITVVGTSNGTNRSLTLHDGTSAVTTSLCTITSSNTITVGSYSYTGEAATFKMYCSQSAFYVYYLKIDYDNING